MEKNVINSCGICGLQVKFSMFNIYKLMEIRDDFERAKRDETRHAELAKLGFDKMSKEERVEFNKLNKLPHLETIENVRIFLNNLLNDFEKEDDDLFTETTTVASEPQAPIGTRENPRMFEEEPSYILP